MYARECTDKKKDLGFIPQNRDKSGNIYIYMYMYIPTINMTIQITDTAGRIGRPQIYPYLEQEQKGIERFPCPFPYFRFERLETHCSVPPNEFPVDSSIDPSIFRDQDSRRFYGCSRTRVKWSIRCRYAKCRQKGQTE